MAVRSTSFTAYLQRTTGIIPASGDFTVSMWYRPFTVTPGGASYRVPYAQIDAPGTYAQYAGFYSHLGTNDLAVSGDNGSGYQETAYQATTLGTWYYVTWVQSGTTQRFYANGTLIGSCTLDRSAVTVGYELLTNDSFATADVDIAYCRQWTAALTVAKIQAEMVSTVPVTTAALWMDCSFDSNLNDASGLSHHWTGVGSTSFVDGPSLPTNTSALTAIDLGTLPVSYTTTIPAGWPLASATPTVKLYYTFTGADDGSLVAGMWAYAPLAGQFRASTLAENVDIGSITAVQVPMDLPIDGGRTWTFAISNDSATGTRTTADETLTISGVAAPTDAVAQGDVVANDESPGFFALARNTSGVALTYLNLVPGEFGDILSTGVLCLNHSANGLALYDSRYNPIATVADPASWTVNSLVSASETQFFIGEYLFGAKVTSLSAAGVYGATTWTVSGNLFRMAVSRDETILYYWTSNATALKRWDLVNNIAMANLAALPVGYHNTALFVLADGTILAGYQKVADHTDCPIKQYATDGTVLQTIATTQEIDVFGSALDDPTSFWVQAESDDQTTKTFTQYLVSGGTVETSFTNVIYDAGLYLGAAIANPERFGSSRTCPFWISRGSTPTPPGDPVEYLIRRERVFPVISHNQNRLFFSKLQVYLEAGLGLATGQGSDPILELDWSDDGGHTWSNLHLIQTGRQGQFTRRAMRWNMGSARERLYRIAVTDPIPWTLIDAFLDFTEGLS